jgi:hypothetical protein
MRTLAIKPTVKRNVSIAGTPWAATALALVMILGLTGCGSFKTFQIRSLPPEHQVIIDGKADDWAGRLFMVEGQKISVGFLNDRDYLYVCLRTDDGAMQRQILRSGLTVWIDPQGGGKKVLGIKYPVGLSSSEQRMWREEKPEETEEPSEVGGNLTDVEIIRQGYPEPEALDIANAEGVELKAATAGKSFVYELKIPLAQSGQEAIGVGAPAGGTVGIGFETGKVDLNSLPRGPGGIAGGAAGMPPVGGYGNPGAVMRPGQLRPKEPEIPENLKVWATVTLSTDANPAPPKVQSLSER